MPNGNNRNPGIRHLMAGSWSGTRRKPLRSIRGRARFYERGRHRKQADDCDVETLRRPASFCSRYGIYCPVCAAIGDATVRELRKIFFYRPFTFRTFTINWCFIVQRATPGPTTPAERILAEREHSSLDTGPGPGCPHLPTSIS